MEESKKIFLECVDAPPTNKTKTCKEVDPGSYKILRFSKKEYKNKNKTFLHLTPIDDKGNETGGEEVITHGFHIEEEINRIEEQTKLNEIIKPVICRLGTLKTNHNKRKFRLCTIIYN